MARTGYVLRILLFFAVSAAIATTLWLTATAGADARHRIPVSYVLPLILLIASGVPFTIGVRRLKAAGHNDTLSVVQVASTAVVGILVLGVLQPGTIRGGVLSALICVAALLNCSPLLFSFWIRRRQHSA